MAASALAPHMTRIKEICDRPKLRERAKWGRLVQAMLRRTQALIAVPVAAVAPSVGAEDFLSCFCGTDRHLPSGTLGFEGAWVQCDDCERWCHGECAGLSLQEAEAIEQLSQWISQGRLKYREDFVSGLEAAPQAFIGLLKGKNFGKLVVEVSR